MKRKLDQNDRPASVHEADKPDDDEPTTVAQQKKQKQQDQDLSFTDLGLDPRLLQAVSKQNFEKPTLVQRRAIPLGLAGKDILCKAKTGSGKTAAYVLPLLASILKRKQSLPSSAPTAGPSTSALILVPTRELADQVFKSIEQFAAFCAKDVQSVKLTDKLSDAVQRSLLSNSPDIVISTPARAWKNVDSGALSLDALTFLVLDEADLILSYGYTDDMDNLARSVPKGVQTVMMSATLSTELDGLRKIFYREPTLLDLEEPEADGEGITHYVVKCGEDEKFLLAYVIFKLHLIKGKCIIFVADIDRSYRLKLFFEQFGIRSCILNSELPVNSRIHVVEEFNRNVYDIIIASDEKSEMLNVDAEEEDEADEAPESKKEAAAAGDDAESDGKRAKKKRKTAKRDSEYGVSRGIDFKNVSTVINFDLPTTASSYTHRIGRTARAGKNGMALSFVVPGSLYRKHMPTTVKTAENDERILAKITRQQKKKGKEVKDYNFNKEQVEAFRYRMNDALRAVTKVAVREARTRELRQELLKSEKLKRCVPSLPPSLSPSLSPQLLTTPPPVCYRYFEENPGELNHVRHDGELRTARSQPHLKHVPEYLLPKEGKQGLTSEEIGFVPLKKRGDRHRKGKRGFKAGSRRGDPLKTFRAKRRTK
ncbi:ATP-dependent RNA helicase DDX56/DBP9 [Geosmithia morbida]|uniref:RNA helicase n=1 Tax=Geosmithia morbida TaxID=1094350 RepID=A0A9P5D9A4_9HYPO|nr:ATP-dependent RNA helicase DDX56/DBP9 [Geosmithia morbida]KAF4126319.1 ATP-dependent RNA helicase DDX56/DBP9 [Geosmithia morbida]